MAPSDMTALMLQMTKQMQEQQLVAQELLQEQQRAADERQRQFMAAILERRACQTPTATRSTIEKSPPIKIDFKEFSGEPEDWTTWSKVHRAQLSAPGCADAFTGTAGDETKVNRDDFDRGSVDPNRLRKAQQAWVSLVTSCKGVAFDIVNAEESASEAWAKLVQHYQASGLKERRHLTIDFYMTKMELGEHPRKFLFRVDPMVKEPERVNRPVEPKKIDIVILSRLTPQYDAEFCMLESSSNWPTREWIERAVINQYERLESEQSAAGSRAMLSAHGHHRNDTPPTRCPLCSRTGHSAWKCREFQITRRETKPNGYQRDGEHGASGGGGSKGGHSRNGGGGGNGRGGESGGVDGNRGGGKQKKVARIPNPAIKPLSSNATSVLTPTEPRNAQTALPPQRRRPLLTPNVSYFWVVSALTLGPGCSPPQALSRLWPHAAHRAKSMKMSTGWQTAMLPKI